MDSKTYNEIVDEVEGLISKGTLVECKVNHYFTNGLYCREIFIPAGTVLTSKIHKTEHPYIVSKGIIEVVKEGQDTELIKAPYFGITYPNTRRVLYCHEDTIWTTMHVTDIKPTSNNDIDIQLAVDKIEATIIKPHFNLHLKSTENHKRILNKEEKI